MRRALLVVVVALMAAPVSVHAAGLRPHFVMWSGTLTPGASAEGVEVSGSGTLHRLEADGNGHVHGTGLFAVSRAKVAAFQSAAEALLLHGPSGAHAGIDIGPYLTVDLGDGVHHRFVTDTGADSPAVTGLLARVNAALPKSAYLVGAAVPGVALRAAPATGVAGFEQPNCPPEQQKLSGMLDAGGTVVTRHLDAETGIRGGIIQSLGPKSGVVGGDAIAYKATAKALPPGVGDPAISNTTVESTIRVGALDPDIDLGPAAAKLQETIDNSFPEQTVNGEQVVFRVHVFPLGPNAYIPPCQHVMLLTHRDIDSVYIPGDGTAVIPWPAPDADMVAVAARMLGLHPPAEPMVTFGGKAVAPLPKTPKDDVTLQPLLFDLSVRNRDPASDPSAGLVTWGPHPSGWNAYDLMNGRGPQVQPGDLANYLANATEILVLRPGDLLLDKDGSQQGMVVTGGGNPGNIVVPDITREIPIVVPPGITVQEDGLVAYCIDLHLDPPGSNGSQAGFDFLGRAGDLGTPAMAALQRVVDQVAARAPGPLEATPGASDAIWRVTDDEPIHPGDEADAADAILAAAGVSPDPADGQAFNAPHFTDPAAGLPGPVALGAGGAPLPPIAAAPAGVVGPKLVGLKLARRLRISRHGATALVARVSLTGAHDTVALALIRSRGHRTVTVGRTAGRVLWNGQTPMMVAARHLRPGTYRLVATGAHSGRVTASVKVTR
jgi:hypothetical protein